MPWGQNGVTTLRRDIDQSVAVAAWGGSSVRLNTNPIGQVGYLKQYELRVEPATTTFTFGNTMATIDAFAAYRALGQFTMKAQGIAALYDLSKGGLDVMLRQYMRTGRATDHKGGLGVIGMHPVSATTATPTLGSLGTSLGRESSNYAGYGYWAEVAGSTNETAGFAAFYDFPITEYVKLPGGSMKDSSGATVLVPESMMEVGLLVMQNTQQNVSVQTILNPLYITAGGSHDAVFSGNTGVPSAGTMAPVCDFYADFYDVPENPADEPSPYQTAFVVTYTTTDEPISGQKVTHNFQAAGLLLRAAYMFFDANDTIIDPLANLIPSIGSSTTVGTDGQVNLLWGSNVYKFQETFSVNTSRSLRRYGEPPPYCLTHDLFADHTLTDVLNTARLTQPRAMFSNIPSSATSLHTLEQRLIPVKVVA